MQESIKKIEDGSFAKVFLKEKEEGYKTMMKFREEFKDHMIEVMGKKLRKN
jgi:ketol-acid reductoisomerase